MYKIILASESPRRREIMETMGITYEVMISNVIEEVEEVEPVDKVKALALLKVNAIADKLKNERDLARDSQEEDGIIIIGADTMVFYEDHALGKPKDKADAVKMLQMLSDHVHEVYTGVGIILLKKDKPSETISFAVGTKVFVQKLSLKQIIDYVDTGEPMDKAGAYGIQGRFGIHIKEIVGDYYNVVGFPIAKIYETLLEHGIDLKE